MENWQNLEKILDKEKEKNDLNNQFTKKLMEACMENNKMLIKSILKEGASLNCFEDSFTPLILAIQNDNLDLAQFFVAVRANINYRPSPNFEDAFWVALKSKKHDFIDLFVKSRSKLLRHPSTHETVLIYATKESDLKSVEIILSHFQIKVNEQDGSGNTALHYNMNKEMPSEDDIIIGKLLLAAGADTNTRNIEGKTPYDLAENPSSKAIIENAIVNDAVTPDLENQAGLDGQNNKPKRKMKL